MVKIDTKPLTMLTSEKVRFKWSKEAQSSFDKIKELLLHDTLLVFPDFTKPFYIDADASNTQLGGIIYQDHGIIAYHSRRLTNYQEKYTTPEKEALSIVDILKTFSTTLLGNKIFINTDSLNLLGKNKLSSRLTRWLLLIQEYDIHLNHIDGKDNVFADTLSRIPRLDDLEIYDTDNFIPCTNLLYEIEQLIPENEPDFALDLVYISKQQLNDQFCLPIINQPCKLINQNFNYNKISNTNKLKILRTNDNRIVVPISCRKQILSFYHEELCHPGQDRTFEIINNNFWWPELHEDTINFVSNCDICKCLKQRTGPKYGLLPLKNTNEETTL